MLCPLFVVYKVLVRQHTTLAIEVPKNEHFLVHFGTINNEVKATAAVF